MASCVQEKMYGVLIMNQPEIDLSSLRTKQGRYRIVVGVERGYGAEFLNLTVHHERQVKKLEGLPLLAKVVVDIIHTSNDEQFLSNIAEIDMTACPKCQCFIPITNEPIIRCNGCFNKPLQERISGKWILKSIKDYKCPWIPLGLAGRELTFEQGSKSCVYETWFETPFFNELKALKIEQCVGLFGWFDIDTVKPAKYFVNVVPQVDRN